MDEQKGKVEVIDKEEKDYIGKTKGIYDSIKDHLSDEYRKQYNVRRFIGCLLLFIVLRYMQSTEDNSLFSTDSIYPLIWAIVVSSFGIMRIGVIKAE